MPSCGRHDTTPSVPGRKVEKMTWLLNVRASASTFSPIQPVPRLKSSRQPGLPCATVVSVVVTAVNAPSVIGVNASNWVCVICAVL